MDTVSSPMKLSWQQLRSGLKLSILGKIFSRQHFEIFFLYSQKTRFDMSNLVF